MGLIRRRLAAHAHDIEIALPLLRLLTEHAPTAALVVPSVSEEGEFLAQAMRRGRGTDLPSPAELRAFQARARSLIQQLGAVSSELVEDYARGLGSSDQRLVRSMFPGRIGWQYQLHPDLISAERDVWQSWIEGLWLWNWEERPENGRFYPLHLAAGLGAAELWVSLARTLRPHADTPLDIVPSRYWRPLGMPEERVATTVLTRSLWALGWLLVRRLGLAAEEAAAACSECVVFYSRDETERQSGFTLLDRLADEVAEAEDRHGSRDVPSNVYGAPGETLGTLLLFIVEPLHEHQESEIQRYMTAITDARPAFLAGVAFAQAVLSDIETAGGWEIFLRERFPAAQRHPRGPGGGIPAEDTQHTASPAGEEIRHLLEAWQRRTSNDR